LRAKILQARIPIAWFRVLKYGPSHNRYAIDFLYERKIDSQQLPIGIPKDIQPTHDP
jgi:hypothetical protein